MTKRTLISTIAIFIAMCLNAQSLELSNLFSDHMVLQQKANVKIWGSASPNSEVSVQLGNTKSMVTASSDGQWTLLLATPKFGGPYKLTISSGKQVLEIDDVLIGEVWFASGQSNMGMMVKDCNNFEEEKTKSDLPEIRFFTVPKMLSNVPVDEMKFGEWQLSSPSSIGAFSAAAYFFAKDLQAEYGIPIGIIATPWGGTPSESFTSIEMHESLQEFNLKFKNTPEQEFQEIMAANSENDMIKRRYKWNSKEGIKKDVHQLSYVDSDWKEMAVPKHFYNTGLKGFKGYVWFRKTIELPSKYINRDLILELGKIEQRDVTYLNGKEIGATDNTNFVRQYPISKRSMKKGKNIIAVRVLHDRWNGGGFWKGPFQLLDAKTGEIVMDLAGTWKYDENIEPLWPEVVSYQHMPSLIFNAMIYPVIPYTIKGAIWYQGEANASRALQYKKIFPAMIDDWRIHWDQGYFPFIFVQLANYMGKDNEPRSDSWALLREAQTETLKLPSTGMASAIDIGDELDIHPKNKQEVGRRLALSARKVAYGEDIIHCGPMYKSHKISGNKIVVEFDFVGEGLKVQNYDSARGFAIAGEDMKFVWAEAEIRDNTTIAVWSDKIDSPIAIRYGWSNNPDASIYNSEDLPAVSFRTDDW
jgi:sialate O-acetylesterase